MLNNNQKIFFINIIFLFIFIYLFKNKLRHIKNDDVIAIKIIDKIKIFKYIHPNIITLFSFVCNFIILYYFLHKKNSNILPIILFLRWLSDLLDGAIARKYKKTSKLGNILDTSSDIMLIGIFLYLFDMKLGFSYKYIFPLYVAYIFFSNYKYSFYTQHDNIKDSKKSNIFISFLVNNSYILFILSYLFYII